jgi:hypothetical protein
MDRDGLDHGPEDTGGYDMILNWWCDLWGDLWYVVIWYSEMYIREMGWLESGVLVNRPTSYPLLPV